MDNRHYNKERETQLYVTEFADSDSIVPNTTDEGEKALLLALLFDGLEVFTKCFDSQDHEEQELFDEVNYWLHEENNDYLFSFDSTCELLDVDPLKLKLGLSNVAFSRSYIWKRVAQELPF